MPTRHMRLDKNTTEYYLLAPSDNPTRFRMDIFIMRYSKRVTITEYNPRLFEDTKPQRAGDCIG